MLSVPNGWTRTSVEPLLRFLTWLLKPTNTGVSPPCGHRLRFTMFKQSRTMCVSNSAKTIGKSENLTLNFQLCDYTLENPSDEALPRLFWLRPTEEWTIPKPVKNKSTKVSSCLSWVWKYLPVSITLRTKLSYFLFPDGTFVKVSIDATAVLWKPFLFEELTDLSYVHSFLGNPLNNIVCLFRLQQNLVSFPSGVVQFCLIYTALSQPWIFTWRTDGEARILWPPNVKSWLIRKDPDAGKDWGQEKKQVTEDEMAGWHHQANGHQFEQNLGDSEGQGSLVCCSPWGHRVGHHLSGWTTISSYLKGISSENFQWAHSEQFGLNWVLPQVSAWGLQLMPSLGWVSWSLWIFCNKLDVTC